MHPTTLVTLPDITAAQRQTLIALLNNAHRDALHTDAVVGGTYASRITNLAQALGLHTDAVPVQQAPAGNAAPSTTSWACGLCDTPTPTGQRVCARCARDVAPRT